MTVGRGREEVPEKTSIWDHPVAGDPLTLPLVESIQLIGIVADTPLLGIQIPPLIKLVPLMESLPLPHPIHSLLLMVGGGRAVFEEF